MTDQPARTPYCTKIRYGITGAPILDGDEMDGSHAPGVGIAPKLIELIYSAARDGKAASVSASVTGTWTRFGERADGQMTTHFTDGPDGWPAWLAEEARLHDPAVSSAGVVQLPPTNQAALRQRVAKALWDANGPAAAEDTNVDAVLSVLPAPVDRAAVLLEAADALGRMDYDTDSNDYGYDTYRDAWNGGVMDGAEELRRMAAEAPATEEQDEAWDLPDARPGTTDHTLTQRSAVVQPAQPHNDETPDSDLIETSTEAALGEAEERLRQVLGVAEVIEANGIGWAADSVRRAAKGELS